MRMIDATEFERNVRQILAEVQATGEAVTIAREGLPFVVLQPSNGPHRTFFLGALAHSAYRYDRPFDPACDPKDWDAVRGEWEPEN